MYGMTNGKRYVFADRRNHHPKVDCPYCGAKKSFSLFWDLKKGRIVDPSCGVCDHKRRCGAIVTPSEFFKKNTSERILQNKTFGFERKIQEVAKVPISDVLPDWMPLSVSDHLCNPSNFMRYLVGMFGAGEVVEVFKMYNVGVTGRYVSAPIFGGVRSPMFWYVDSDGDVLDVKSIEYNEDGHRNKENEFSTIFYHTRMERPNQDKYRQKDCFWAWRLKEDCILESGSKPDLCLFGEHLLRDFRCGRVALVESEKTAIMSTLFFRFKYPDQCHNILFLATGGLTQLRLNNIVKLKGHEVILLPDRDGLNAWKERRESLITPTGIESKIVNVEDLAAKYGVDIDSLKPNADFADVIEEYFKTLKS